ncbi:DUF4198 domain-containing protein [Pseudoponticoccus marisrubri]|uniref:DUF4198 domain-containing protein n=1 Tax=Pseudoponticoccus marisrubri TaxID=1685382 RepID=A0A0W7WFG4_9RHOB|nr:DUF4198 domain-containing protein [Pseudoponticoccus marisrubri]KUF09325.1 hypothetical protein AVJ23_17940 [Pseudoponticoccus marisrubri]
MRCLIAVLALLAAPAAAHEFWIDPHDFRIDPGDAAVADIRVGEKLEGVAYRYVPRNFRRFDIVTGAETRPVEGRAGDRPALDMALETPGLSVVVHVSRDHDLTYTEWQKFVDFCAHKDFDWAVERHLDRGLGKEVVRERYSRHAKSLIAVGEGAGADRQVGLVAEIVARANPYTDALDGRFPVTVYHEGAPRPDAQVEVFERAPDGSVTVSLYRTDAEGHAEIAVTPGHMYLVDHVVMRELPVTSPDDPAWESLWASLTFEVPG